MQNNKTSSGNFPLTLPSIKLAKSLNDLSTWSFNCLSDMKTRF